MRRYAPESETERRSTTRPRQCTATSERRCSEVAFDRASRVEIFTDNEQFNDWINRSAADLQLLITETRHGLYPYAGVPWFSTPFGRGGLITALQTLWSQLSIATDARPSDPLRTVRCRGLCRKGAASRRAAAAAVPPDQGTSVCPTGTRAARCCAPDHVTPPSGAMSFNLESLIRRVPRHPSQSIGRFFVVRCPVSGYRILDAPGACSRSSRSERPNGSTCDFRGPRVGPSIAKVGRRG